MGTTRVKLHDFNATIEYCSNLLSTRADGIFKGGGSYNRQQFCWCINDTGHTLVAGSTIQLYAMGKKTGEEYNGIPIEHIVNYDSEPVFYAIDPLPGKECRVGVVSFPSIADDKVIPNIKTNTIWEAVEPFNYFYS